MTVFRILPTRMGVNLSRPTGKSPGPISAVRGVIPMSANAAENGLPNATSAGGPSSAYSSARWPWVGISTFQPYSATIFCWSEA